MHHTPLIIFTYKTSDEESYPPGLGGFSPAWTQVEERTADGRAAEGEHHFHYAHQDERNPQDNGGALVGKQAHPIKFNPES